MLEGSSIHEQTVVSIPLLPHILVLQRDSTTVSSLPRRIRHAADFTQSLVSPNARSPSAVNCTVMSTLDRGHGTQVIPRRTTRQRGTAVNPDTSPAHM